MAWFKRESVELDTSGEKRVKTEGLWVKCDQCRQIIWKKDLDAEFQRLSQVRPAFPHRRAHPAGYLLDDGKYRNRRQQPGAQPIR